MRQINLLPWRERRLEAMKRTFVMQTVFTVVVVIFIVLAAHKLLTHRLVKQVGVNRILEQHIADLNTQVTEVDQFRDRQAVVRDRMRVIADISSISTLRTRANNLSNFDVAELAELDTIAEWPQPVRQFLLLGTLLLGLLIGYFYFLSEPRRAIEAAQALEDQLRADFSHKAREASQLDAMKGQVAVIDLAFNGLLRQLPSSAEVPSLVDDITEAGLGYGLEFSRIQLQGETMREFFYELPIEIALVGSYHDFGMFVSGVASLGRIVTLHDFKIDSSAEKGQKMRLLARTYRYDEEFVFMPSAETELTDGAL